MAITTSLRASIIFAHGFKCFYCGHDADEVDHIVPYSKSKEETDVPENLVAACKLCNNAKGQKWLPEEVLAEAKNAARHLAGFVVTAQKIFEGATEVGVSRIKYGSLPLCEGIKGIAYVTKAKPTIRPARVIAKRSAAIVRKFLSEEEGGQTNPLSDTPIGN